MSTKYPSIQFQGQSVSGVGGMLDDDREPGKPTEGRKMDGVRWGGDILGMGDDEMLEVVDIVE